MNRNLRDLIRDIMSALPVPLYHHNRKMTRGQRLRELNYKKMKTLQPGEFIDLEMGRSSLKNCGGFIEVRRAAPHITGVKDLARIDIDEINVNPPDVVTRHTLSTYLELMEFLAEINFVKELTSL